MTATLMEVSGLYAHRDEGEKAAQTLRERGYGPVSVYPLTKERIARLPEDRKETEMVKTVLAAPIGFMVGAVMVAVPVGLVGGVLFAAPAALLCGVMGAVVGLTVVNLPSKQHRQMQKEDAVVVTTPCEEEGREEVVRTFHETQAMEVDITTAGG